MEAKIFYGAGGYAIQNFSRWLEKIGEPVCFADIDSKKHDKLFSLGSKDSSEGYPIYSLADAITKYPDYIIYVTAQPGNLQSITNYLLEQSIPKERIRYCEEVVYRRGCRQLSGEMVVSKYGITACCTPYSKLISYNEKMPTEQSVRSAIGDFRLWLKDTLERMKTDVPTDCDGCSLLKWDYWPRDVEIRWLSAGAGFANTTCNSAVFTVISQIRLFLEAIKF